MFVGFETCMFVCSQEQMNTCKFDIFKVESLTDNQPLLFVGYELFQRYDLMTKFKVYIHSA